MKDKQDLESVVYDEDKTKALEAVSQVQNKSYDDRYVLTPGFK